MSERTPAVLESLALLDRAAALTPTSLTLEADLSFEQFEALGRALGNFRDASAWWAADWLLYGERRFGEEFAQAVAALKREKHTMQNWMWVASNVPPSRRRESLTFSHHERVAALSPVEQVQWLDLAETEGLSSGELRERLPQAHPLEALVPVQLLADRATARLARRLTEDAIIELTVRVGEKRYHATGRGELPSEPVEMAMCPRHGPKPVEKVVAGITYLACGCHTVEERDEPA